MRVTTMIILTVIASVCVWGVMAQGPATAQVPSDAPDMALVAHGNNGQGPFSTGFAKKIAGTYWARYIPTRDGCNYPCDESEIPAGADVCSSGLGCCCGGPDIEPGDEDFCIRCYAEEFPEAQAIFTIHEDGTYVEDTSVDAGEGVFLSYSPIKGTWKQIGPRKIAVTAMAFGYDVGGLFTGTVNKHFTSPYLELEITFSSDYSYITNFDGTVWAFVAPANPIENETPVYPTFGYIPFEAYRLER